jgi:hypothetical protein
MNSIEALFSRSPRHLKIYRTLKVFLIYVQTAAGNQLKTALRKKIKQILRNCVCQSQCVSVHEMIQNSIGTLGVGFWKLFFSKCLTLHR